MEKYSENDKVRSLLMYRWVPPPLNIPFLHEFPYNIDLQAGVFRLALKRTYGHYKNLVPDTDLEIRGARSFRPLDKGGGGLHKFFFGSSGLILVWK